MLGIEKTFLDGLWSLELRTRLFGSRGAVFDDGFTTDGFSLGNLAVIAKCLIYESQTTGVAIGSAVSAPTGDDARFAVIDEIFTINNDVAHLTPFLAFLFAPGDRVFYHGFIEVGVPAAGNRLEARAAPPGVGPFPIGQLNAQAVACFDFSANYWLYRNPMADGVTAVTSALEFHFVTALHGEDDIFLKPIDSFVEFGNRRNRFDFVSLTLGLDAEIYNNLNVRVAGIVPITEGDDRFFDVEVKFSINRRF